MIGDHLAAPSASTPSGRCLASTPAMHLMIFASTLDHQIRAYARALSFTFLVVL